MLAAKTSPETKPHRFPSFSHLNRLEPLEPRVLLSSVLFITAPAVPLDSTHFHSLQDALAVAVAGDTLVLQAGFSPRSTLLIDKALTLTADVGVVLNSNLELAPGTSGVTLSNLTLSPSAILSLDANTTANIISGSVISNLVLDPASHANQFTGNTFTGPVTITGSTGNILSTNIFTSSTGDALTLTTADNTTVQNNTFTISQDFANGIVVADSQNVLLLSNQISSTGMGGTGIYAFTDGADTSVDVRNNTLSTTGSGTGIYLAKWDSAASFQVRVQGNVLADNATGVMIYGDGSSAGNIDLGGGSTIFGSSTGGNDFTSFSAADSVSYAIGLAGTSDTFTVSAQDNLWSVPDPMTAVADSSHDLPAGGTGIIDAADLTETLTLSLHPLSALQSASLSTTVAHFDSTLVDTPSDFAVLIDWGDGTTSTGTVVNNATGGFDVLAAHTWSTAGNFTLSIFVQSDEGGTAQAGTQVAVTPRILTSTGLTLNAKKGTLFSGAVATFTDGLPGTLPANYTVTVTWSDGLVTAGTVTKNADGSFTVKTARFFSAAGKFTATIAVTTLDGLFSTSVNSTVNVTAGKKSHRGAAACHHLRILPRKIIPIILHALATHADHCSLTLQSPAHRESPPKPRHGG